MKKSYSIVSFFVIMLLLFMSFSGCIEDRETIVYDGLERGYILHLPPDYNETETYSLVIALHGGGGNAENIESVTGFSQKADEEGFIVVYPDGTGRFKHRILTWNAGFCCGYALDNEIDDVGYIDALIKHLQEEYFINPDMIYATGISNGGIMTYRLGAELSDVFAAIAPVSAQIGGQATEQEEIWRIPIPENPVSVISFNGMNDTRVPYYGGRPADNDTHVYSWMSTNESIAFWIQYNHCNAFPQRNVSESGNVIIDTYEGGDQNTAVTLVTIVDGTHSWPGGQRGWKNGDPPTQELNATDVIWDFFKEHPKNK
jgi:polyhydroxybutyrate depolymerase